MKQNPFTGAWEHKKTIKKDEKATTPSGSKKQPPRKAPPKPKKILQKSEIVDAFCSGFYFSFIPERYLV